MFIPFVEIPPSAPQERSMWLGCRLVHQPSDDATLVGWLWGQASMICTTAYSVLLQSESWVVPLSENVPFGSHLTATQVPQSRPDCDSAGQEGAWLLGQASLPLQLHSAPTHSVLRSPRAP